MIAVDAGQTREEINGQDIRDCGVRHLMVSADAFAQEHGIAQEARAMLDRAVAAVKTDKTKALDMFNKGQVGKDGRTFKDDAGKAYGQALFRAGQNPEGQVTEVTDYLISRPSHPKPVPKNSFVTRVGDIYCGVGYYK